MSFSTIKVLINNFSIFNHTTSDPIKISSASFRFNASQSNNSICFDSDYDLSVGYTKGPSMDNITLVKLPLDSGSYKIHCTSSLDYL